MSSTHDSCDKLEALASSSGFDDRGACHGRIRFTSIRPAVHRGCEPGGL